MICGYCGATGAVRSLVTGGTYSPETPICEKCWKDREACRGIWVNRVKSRRSNHEWDAVCDEKGNQIGDLVRCDLCKKTVHMSQLNSRGQIKK